MNFLFLLALHSLWVQGNIRFFRIKYDFIRLYTTLYQRHGLGLARFLSPLRRFLRSLQPVHAHAGTQPLRVDAQYVRRAPCSIDAPVRRLQGV